MDEPDIAFASIADLGARIRRRELGCVELTHALLSRIERLDSKLGAFVATTERRALREAAAAQQALDAGIDRGPLHGIPYAAKDLFDIAGEPNSAGTRLLEDNVAERDCAAVRKLAEAGMVLLGRLHTVQLASTIIGVNHERGTPKNPWHPEHHIPGGSSSGSAVAVAAGLVPVALGSDTGGSVRAPASLCGTVGLKTTVGSVSRAGVYPLSETLDSVGPLTRTVEDAALVHAALAGPDPEDPITLGKAPDDPVPTLNEPLRGLRFSFGTTRFFDRATDEVQAAVRAAGDVLADGGARVDERELPEVAQAARLASSTSLLAAEGYAVNRSLFEHHGDALDPVVTWLRAGASIRAYEYLEAAARRRALERAMVERMQGIDALLVPTTPDVAHPLAEVDASMDSHARFAGLYTHCTFPGNLLGLCAVSVPCGFTAAGLPMGLMVYAKPFDEAVALRVARAFEGATEHHRRRPELSWAEP